MEGKTPRMVYRWYSWIYTASVFVGGLGYCSMVVSFFHVPFSVFGLSEEVELSLFQVGFTLSLSLSLLY
jgi:hypothetical protein